MSKALIIVDIQNDFVEGGNLAVEGGRNLSRKIGEFVAKNKGKRFDYVITTQDWHIDPGSHFSENPDFIDTWPVHCVADENGSSLTPELLDSGAFGKIDVSVKKGMFTAAYSGFEGVTDDGGTLDEVLSELNVDSLIIVGIATDHCVLQTVRSALKLNRFEVEVVSDLCLGITEASTEKAFEEMRNSGVVIS